MTNEELWSKIERALIILKPQYLLHFEVQIVEHCNLDCKQCDHFSPLAEEEYLDINNYKRDCSRLSELFDGEMSFIKLLGGEPLLHPQITEFMKITREMFPIGRIELVTNGLLLPSMPENFWEACKKYDVIIRPTCYPINLDYAALGKTADSKGVKFLPYNYEHNSQHKMPIGPFRSDDGSSFFDCDIAMQCITLKNGKLYPCSIAAHVPHLKKYFKLDMRLSEKNGVDIYSVKSGDELLEKLSGPIPFCRYCDVAHKRYMRYDWGISKKDRYEWLAFGFTEDDMKYLKSKELVVYVFGAGLWGNQTVALLQKEGIAVKNVISTRKKEGIDNIRGVPVITLNELGEVESNSICLVALSTRAHKREVYPLLSQIAFGNVVPIYI